MTAPAISCPRGDTLSETFAIDSDISGWTPRWTLKAAQGWQDAPDPGVLTCLVGSGLTVAQTSPTGVIALALTAAQTASLAPGAYVWDLQMTSGAQVRTVQWDAAGATVGTLTVAPDVTRTTP